MEISVIMLKRGILYFFLSCKKGGIPISKKILCQSYYLKKIIGSGGNGTVYLAKHMTLHYKCIIKCIRKFQKFQVNSLLEANILKRLKHPFIPSLYDTQEDEKYYYLIEEFLEGRSLDSYSSRKKLSHSQLISILYQLCEILQYLHEQNPEPILYLDLQPKNILIQKGKVKLVDFGNSRSYSDLKKQKFFYGTLGFAAPEQYEGGEIEESTDIYSLGAVFYFLFTKEIPSNKTSWKEIPENYQNIIKNCLYHKKEERYQSILEVKKEIQKLKERENTKKWRRKWREKKLTVAVAGTKAGIGVTHICFALAKYIAKRQDCLYLEKNSSKTVEFLIKQEGLRYEKVGYRYQSFYLGEEVEEEWEKISVIIKDYGRLTEENYEEFQKEEHKIMVMGIRPWQEMGEWKERLKGEKILYLVNFTEGKEFYIWQKKNKIGYRVPYMPDPFTNENRTFWENIYKNIDED